MTEWWTWFFIPLWITGFLMGLFANQISKFFEEPKAFVLRQGTVIESPKALEEVLFHQKR
tara:strand:+ start:958 stop:1137 length:180 start_codon:yes stop_codon:yes gene_type:complete